LRLAAISFSRQRRNLDRTMRGLDNQIDHENNGNEDVKPIHWDQGIATIQQQKK